MRVDLTRKFLYFLACPTKSLCYSLTMRNYSISLLSCDPKERKKQIAKWLFKIKEKMRIGGAGVELSLGMLGNLQTREEAKRLRNLERSKQWYRDHREARTAYRRAIPDEKRRAYLRKWYAGRGKATMRVYMSNPMKRIMINFGKLVRNYLGRKTHRKGSRTMRLLGCTPTQLRTHLESQFADWMSWENYGDWQIDHILPCASFDLTDPDQQRVCFHHTNLRPLCRRQNASKGKKVLPHIVRPPSRNPDDY